MMVEDLNLLTADKLEVIKMMYMFDHEEIHYCAACDLAHVTRHSPLMMECSLDTIDVECTDVDEGLPFNCPLIVVTHSSVDAFIGKRRSNDS